MTPLDTLRMLSEYLEDARPSCPMRPEEANAYATVQALTYASDLPYTWDCTPETVPVRWDPDAQAFILCTTTP